MKKTIVFLKALSVFLGTVIGVGIFGLPFVAERAGFFIIFIYFLVMTLVAILIHFLYGEVVLETKETHRFPGYVGEYLGVKWKKIAFIVVSICILGALLAYLIIGGQFLSSLFANYLGGNVFLYTFLFFIFGSYLVFRGIKSVSKTEIFLLSIFLSIIIMFLIKSFPFIDLNNLKVVNLKYLTFPFGIVLFSLWGTAIVPEVKEILSLSIPNKGKLKLNLKAVLASGIIFSAIIYLLFIFIILGASGVNTSEESLSGMVKILGTNSGIIKLGFILGIICCFTSFIALALTLKKVFWYDFGLSKNFSWFLACFPPLILFVLGIQKFIEVINFTGAFAIGSEGIIIVFLYKKFMKKKFGRNINKFYYFLIPIFILGIIFEIIHLI